MTGFIPQQLHEELLREYLIVHWTDRYSNQEDLFPPAVKLQSGPKFRSSEISDNHSNQLLELIQARYPERNLDKCKIILNKLHDGDHISDSSHSEFLISITNNDTQWYNTQTETYLSLPYNELVDMTGTTLSLPTIEEGSYYYLDVFVPENA